MKIRRILDQNSQAITVVERDGKYFPVLGNLFEDCTIGNEPVKATKELYPIEPHFILGIGANYRGLFDGKPLPEYPVVFFKGPNTLQHPGDPIILPRLAIQAETVKYEGELVVVIGRGGKNIKEEDAMDHVFGYTIANDVSASDWQRERVGNQWCKGKGFDTFCPLGPVIVTKDELPAPEDLRIITRINGQVEQDESVSQMCFSVPQLIAFLSAGHSIHPGDIILTGTPPGARFLEPGETVDIEIPGIGNLVNPVVEER